MNDHYFQTMFDSTKTNYQYAILNEAAFEYDIHFQRVSKTEWQGLYTNCLVYVNVETGEVREVR